MTSVIGHIFQLDFDARPSSDGDAYDAPVVKVFTDSARKARVAEHLRSLAEGSSELCLWLDAAARRFEGVSGTFGCSSVALRSKRGGF